MLVPHGADSTPRVDELFVRLHDMGFRRYMEAVVLFFYRFLARRGN